MYKILVIIAIAIAIVVIAPVATIWALNTLFPALAIPLTFETWCAAFLLSAVVSGQGLTFSNKK
jgi:hypothetical protein